MGLSGDTYFYADEIRWFPLKGIKLRKGKCQPDFYQSLVELDRDWRAAEEKAG